MHSHRMHAQRKNLWETQAFAVATQHDRENTQESAFIDGAADHAGNHCGAACEDGHKTCK